jgi:hypothetical protein
MVSRSIQLLAACGLTLLCGAAEIDEATQLREPTYDDGVYVNCQFRMAAIFPGKPQFRDFTYTVARQSVPAREFYVQQGANRYSVIVADFTKGPAVDNNLIAAAAIPLKLKGEVRFEAMADYDPGIPGRQLNIFLPNGRQHRASVYMADHRLYITEADAPEGDFAALQFEQSVSIINAKGTDLDKNPGQPSRQYRCQR